MIGLPAKWTGEWMIGCRASEIAPVREAARISPRPLLLVQDGDDRLCPPEETQAILAAAGEPKSLWTVPGAGHIMAALRQPREFENRVAAFFVRALAAQPKGRRA